MQSGRAVGEAIERAAGQVRRQADEQAAQTRQLDGHVEELLGRRSDALSDLARHYLPDISEQSIDGTFVEIRDDLLAVLARKQRRQGEIESTIASQQRMLQTLEVSLADVTDRLNEKVVQRDELEKILSERLHGSEEFMTLSQRALEAEQKLEQNERRVAEIKDEASRKLPSYENSRLFKYLYDRNYGTSAYGSEGFTKRMDRWVAKLIDYSRARRGYEFLRETPPLMAAEVERRRDKFNDLMEQVEAIEDRVSDEVGLTVVMREGQELGSQRDQIVAESDQCQKTLLAQQQELLSLERPDNEFYVQAVARMENFLANLRHAQLEHQSHQTPERKDDTIVAEIAWLNDQMHTADQQIGNLNRQRALLEQRLAGLQALVQHFRQAEFDSQRSQFSDSLSIDRLLAQLVDGEITPDEVWGVLRQNQRFIPTWHDSRGGDLGDVFDSDFSQVLLHVLADVAGQAMRNSAYRGVQRRGPVRRETRRQTGRPTFRKRGFTNGRGF